MVDQKRKTMIKSSLSPLIPLNSLNSLSTSLIDDAEPIRMRINKRDKLEQDSDIVITQIRAIDNSRFIEKLGKLTLKELKKIKKLFEEVTF